MDGKLAFNNGFAVLSSSSTRQLKLSQTQLTVKENSRSGPDQAGPWATNFQKSFLGS
jgi:hypothetical protein